MKELYVYKVNKEVKRENRVENEDGTTTISQVVDLVPTEVVLKKPSRRDREDMAMVYNAEFHKCLANGISTEEMIRRAVLDGGGGFIPKHDLETLHELYKRINAIMLEVAQKKIDKEDISELQAEMEKLYIQIYDIESPQKSVYNHSAEALATRKSLIWGALTLTYLRKDKDYEPVFKGPTFESRLNSYYDMCDEDGFKFEMTCFDKSYVMIERFLSKAAETKEEFELIEQELDKFATDQE